MATDSDTPNKTHAVPESIKSPVKLVGGGGELAMTGLHPHVCDPQDQQSLQSYYLSDVLIIWMPELNPLTTVEDPSFIASKAEEPTFPSLNEQTVHQEI